jgi:hypothetical protein
MVGLMSDPQEKQHQEQEQEQPPTTCPSTGPDDELDAAHKALLYNLGALGQLYWHGSRTLTPSGYAGITERAIADMGLPEDLAARSMVKHLAERSIAALGEQPGQPISSMAWERRITALVRSIRHDVEAVRCG